MEAEDKNTSLEDIKIYLEQNKNEMQNYFTKISEFQEVLLSKLNEIQEKNQEEINSLKEEIESIKQTNEEINSLKAQNGSAKQTNEGINSIRSQMETIKQTNDEIKQFSEKNEEQIKALQEQVNDLKRRVRTGFSNNEDLIKAEKKSIVEIRKCIPIIHQIKDQVIASQQDNKSQKDRYILNYMIIKDILPLKFDYDQNSTTISYDGILKFLNSKFGNPFEQQIIEIKGQNSEKSIQNLGNLNNTVTFHDKIIQFDFKGFQFSYKGMQLQDLSKEDEKVRKKYILEGSHSGIEWKQVANYICSFSSFSTSLNNFSDHFYRYFRIRLDDPKQFIKLNKIEFYGVLENPSCKKVFSDKNDRSQIIPNEVNK